MSDAAKKGPWDAIREIGGLFVEGIAEGKIPDRVAEEIHREFIAKKIVATCPTCGAPLHELTTAGGQTVQLCAPCSGLKEG